MKTTLQILQEAKRLLIEKGWTQGYFATDDRGFHTPWFDPEAACYCGQGAIRAAHGGGFLERTPAWRKAHDALDDAVGEAFGWDFPEFNDAEGRTLEEVLAMFDKAIAAEAGLCA